MSHVGLFNTAQSRRYIPFLLHLAGKIEHAVQRLPLRAAVLTAKQTKRTDAHLYHTFVMAVHSQGAHITFQHLLPGLAGLPCPITAAERHRREYDLRFVV